MPPAKRPPDEPPDPAPVPDPGAPQWAVDLRRTIEELPAKLRATITDDDRSSIAERVHSLFESSGAFQAPEAEPEPPPEPEPAIPTGNGSGEPEPGGDSWARRMFGRY